MIGQALRFGEAVRDPAGNSSPSSLPWSRSTLRSAPINATRHGTRDRGCGDSGRPLRQSATASRVTIVAAVNAPRSSSDAPMILGRSLAGHRSHACVASLVEWTISCSAASSRDRTSPRCSVEADAIARADQLALSQWTNLSSGRNEAREPCWLLLSTDAGVSARTQRTRARDEPRASQSPARRRGGPEAPFAVGMISASL